jgi:hypothetical protein
MSIFLAEGKGWIQKKRKRRVNIEGNQVEINRKE